MLAKTLKAGLIAAQFSGSFLAISHYALKPLGETFPFKHPTFNYIYGSAACLTALGAALVTSGNKNPVVTMLLAGEIWAVSGGYVVGTYLLDTVTDRVQVMVINSGEKKDNTDL
jgi:hypothetical protein